jgi:hypothetical protein
MQNEIQYLVIGRCGMDDVPIRLCETQKQARRCAGRLLKWQIARYALRILDIDPSIFCSTGYVPFINGRPRPYVLVREL